ncbi:carboxymuconolactone decarboxylase family protein [Actinoallomurus spadix]|uniref:Carboxymuconolactone decarboxylase family protein n=1 Tax=Actinoallomurus spadix TaxID=79912 RepID=A0ABP3GBA5_9ACTN|nr:carboxymuconolactone decarboxylase family protein [Actinoallomurus spadix]MCO5984535.1 carboxymuconolactone decarboxylase family protein [Actinoallomurus spadix]
MPPRMTNPSLVVPDALPPLLELTKVIGKVGLPQKTLDLVRLRVSQINRRPINLPEGEADERLLKAAEWRDASCFDAAERAALALAEVLTRIDDRDDPVPDELWAEAARQYDEQELGALVIQIGLVNLWNRVNVATREVPGDLS